MMGRGALELTWLTVIAGEVGKMTFTRCLTVLVIALPLLAWVMEFLAGAVISERHHLHHDTYSVSMVVSRTLALVMLFMGALGGVTGWLCHLGVFSMRPLLPLAFFVSFQVTLLLMIVAVLRYRVMAYADHMIVRPAFGQSRTIAYDDITRMEWVSSYLGPHLRDLRVHSKGAAPVRLWCLLDVEQLLLRLDRFDALEG